jgi:uncharacterized protein
MKERSYNLHDGKMGSAITVRLTPKASRNEISEILDDGTIKIRLMAPADDEKSNTALTQFLSQVLQVDEKQIEIVSGSSGKDKLVTIINLDKETAQHRILTWFSNNQA